MLGFVNVFKPAGLTSVQTGALARRFVAGAGRKLAVGHLGTLDPMAAGVLPIALGKATRLIPLIEDRRKSYVCTLALGRSTSTGDALGETVRESSVPSDADSLLRSIAPSFVGSIDQVPPMFSALHYAGQRLYDLARAGKSVERQPRKVTIYGLRILGQSGANEFRLSVACSEGTYIRTLCEDLGTAIGSPAHMGALLRDASGPFVLYESHTLAEIEADPAGVLISPERIIPFPTIVLDPRGAADFRAGRIVTLPAGAAGRHVFVRDPARTLVGVGEALGTLLAPRKVFG